MMKKLAGYFSTAYLMIMFCVYPFYVEKGYTNIGSAKNRFFMAVSVASFGVLLICYLADWFGRTKENKKSGQAYLVDWGQVSVMDLLVLCYATEIFLSYVFSIERSEALWGTKGWYMGMVPILLLCGLYFLISRLWKRDEIVYYGVMAASVSVFLLGICNRFSFYPVQMEGAQAGFISTLGNINWFCGFLSVTAPIGITLYVVKHSSIRWKRIGLTAYAMITFASGFAQGSDSIFLWYGAIFFLLLWIGLEKREYLQKWFLLVFLWGISAQLIRVLRLLFVGRYNYDAGGLCGYFTRSSLSLWIAFGALAGYFVVKKISKTCRKEREEAGNRESSYPAAGIRSVRKLMITVPLLIVMVYLVLAVLHTKWGLPFLQGVEGFTLNEEWGHGRGISFYAGVSIFAKQPILQKLLGVGPDCFSIAAYEIPSLAAMLRAEFGSARLTNAHNEILTGLVNTGIFGVLLYLGILLYAVRSFVRAGKKQEIVCAFALCIFGYLIHNMVSFAQVLNFPYVFLVLGMGEAYLRNLKKEKEMQDGETIRDTSDQKE